MLIDANFLCECREFIRIISILIRINSHYYCVAQYIKRYPKNYRRIL